MDVKAEDIVERLWCRGHRHFYHKPSVEVVGQLGSFGELRFIFGPGSHRIESFQIYLQDEQSIKDLKTEAQYAILNYDMICASLMECEVIQPSRGGGWL